MDNLISLQSYFSSELILICGILALFVVAMRSRVGQKRTALTISVITLGFSLVAVVATHYDSTGLKLFYGMLSLDPFAQFFKVMILLTTLVTVILASAAKELSGSPRPEFYGFLLVLALGLNLLSSASHLLMVYLSLEMSSLSAYLLAGFMTAQPRSQEASLKYVLYGGVASGVMIFGMSLLYGLSGGLSFEEIHEFVMVTDQGHLALFVALVLTFVGFGYKMAVVPFHMWAPDVYEGSPMTVTAFLSVASKAGGFAVMMRFFCVAFIDVGTGGVWQALGDCDWPVLIGVLSAVTMTVGNIMALGQNNIKRFLAYSSIAHAGYLLMGVAVVSRVGVEAILFYFIIYFIMNLGAFAVALVLSEQLGSEDLQDYRGLVRQGKFGVFLAFAFTIFLFSLIGLPPFAGFVAKWYVFKAVVDAGLLWLALVGVVNSLIGLFYYVRLIKFMMVDERSEEKAIPRGHLRYGLLIGVLAILTLVFGLYFGPLARWASVAAGMGG